MKRTKLILMHLGVWVIYWCVEVLKFSLISVIRNDLWIEILINLFCGTALFYTLIFFVLPTEAGRIRAFRFMWRLTLALLAYLALRRGGFLFMAEWADFKSPVVTNIKFFFVSGFDLFTQFGAYAVLVWFFRRQGALQKQMLQKELEEERLKHELLETKFGVLKAQINPHFLFNTLNFIHSKAISSDDHVIDKTVLLLSDILRHTLRDSTNAHPLPVNEELDHIQKLCELNKLRFNGRFYLKAIEQGREYNKKIPPFVLLTFFENAMKYGVFNDPENPVLLYITQSSDLLEVRLENRIRKPASVDNRAQFSIGKRYVKNVLEQFHKNNYILEYRDDGTFHIVYLKIYEG